MDKEDTFCQLLTSTYSYTRVYVRVSVLKSGIEQGLVFRSNNDINLDC